MELHGSIANNLASALKSARRLRGRPVHADTLAHWAELVRHARRELAAGSKEAILNLTIELENQLRHRRIMRDD
jgi:hypothetical protein